MILYLDTSALIKIYLAEPGSELLRQFVDESDFLVASHVAYPETRSALARALRSQIIDLVEFDRIKARFEDDWRHVAVISVTSDIIRHAGDLAEKYYLRGFDAVHLASAINIRSSVLHTGVVFSSWDIRLVDAARLERFEILTVKP